MLRLSKHSELLFSNLLKLLDDPVAPALRLERRDDVILDQDANVPIGDIAVDFGDPFVLRGGKDFAVAVGVGEQAALARDINCEKFISFIAERSDTITALGHLTGKQSTEKLSRSPSTVLRTNGWVLILLRIFRSC